MAGRLSMPSEVVGGLYQGLAEVVLPDPIHHHAGSQRIAAIDDPVRQL